MRIGRYYILLGRYVWFQIRRPATIKRYLGFILVVKEARPTDVDKTRRFPPNTLMVHNGRKYKYLRIYKQRGLEMTYIIEGRANTVIKHKALIYTVRPYQISRYGRIMLYKGTK